MVIILPCYHSQHLQALFHPVHHDEPPIHVLLECLTRDVEGQVLRVDSALDYVEPFRHQFVTIVDDGDTAHILLDVVSLLLDSKRLRRSPAWNEQQSSDLLLFFCAKVFDSEVVFPAI